MKLKSVQVHFFRHVLDSTPVEIQPDVTCLVGKNESGKTAFLEALWRLKPANGKPDYDITKQYPAWLEKRHRRERDLESQDFVTATFELDDEDRAAVATKFGDVLVSTAITVSMAYNRERTYSPIKVNEPNALARFIADLDLPASLIPRAAQVPTFDEMQTFAAEIAADDAATSAKIATGLQERFPDGVSLQQAVADILAERLPGFFYYQQYSSLPGIVKIRELLQKKKDELTLDELTARSLLEQAGAEDDYLLNPDYQKRRRELENVANAISQDVLEYWTTNKHLRALIDITHVTVNTNKGQQAVLDELHLRMYDNSHMLSLPFGERSSGFQWFFSFLAAFAPFEHSRAPVVILLDEPGLGLHARAQRDFLRFIDERLKNRQVIYSTHSPFMVQPGKLERARIVEDRGTAVGSVVSSDVLTTDPDTLFPLQGALGYDIAQHLLIGAHNLVVEGVSDFLYLTTISDHLQEQGRKGLDARWSIVPVGGADQIPTFVALLGVRLDLSVLVDSRKQGQQRLTKLAQDGFLAATRIIAIGTVTGMVPSDIEDIFEPVDYLNLYNKAFGKSLTAASLTGSDSIVNKIARAEGVERFNHNKPAEMLVRDRSLLAGLSAKTLSKFEELIDRINQTLPPP